MWYLPDPGIESLSSARAGGLFPTEPPGNLLYCVRWYFNIACFLSNASPERCSGFCGQIKSGIIFLKVDQACSFVKGSEKSCSKDICSTFFDPAFLRVLQPWNPSSNSCNIPWSSWCAFRLTSLIHIFYLHSVPSPPELWLWAFMTSSLCTVIVGLLENFLQSRTVSGKLSQECSRGFLPNS